MKRQFTLSITAGSEVAQFLDGLGHKRGVVIEAMIAQHLREHKGYLSPEAAIEAGYRFSEKDTEFARGYRGEAEVLPPLRLGETPTEKQKKNQSKNVPKPKLHPSPKQVVSEETNERSTADEPAVKNKDMILAGLSAFMG